MRTSKSVSAGRFNRPARLSPFKTCLVAVTALAMMPAQAFAQPISDEVRMALQGAGKADHDVRAFYASRDHRPIWIQGSQLGPEAETLLELIETAHLDGLDPDRYRSRALTDAIRRAWGGSPKALARAEMLLSQTFAAYVRDVRRPRDVGMLYVDRQLAPTVPSASSVLQAAVSAPSLQQHLENVSWMHPLYGQLRKAVAKQARNGPPEELLRINLDRARALPANPGRKYILVDAAAARLWMYEDGEVRDSMKVVVGKSTDQTPMMAGLIRYTMVNPYWNIPPDLVRKRIAPSVLDEGPSYLKTKRYEVLSDWTDDARVLKPTEVDWEAVAAGRKELPVRQRPGGDNAMGKMKFMFPNDLGIYLHDTPEKQLFREDERLFSAGCVRLEDAPRLAKWLFNKPLVVKGGAPERRVDLPEPVPVYITYMTAAPQDGTIAYRDDIYNRDKIQMARLQGRSYAAR